MSKFGDLIRGKSAPAPAVAPPAPAPEPVVVENPDESDDIEATKPAPEIELKDMSKLELEELGRTMGVELDRRLSQPKLVKQIEELMD